MLDLADDASLSHTPGVVQVADTSFRGVPSSPNTDGKRVMSCEMARRRIALPRSLISATPQTWRECARHTPPVDPGSLIGARMECSGVDRSLTCHRPATSPSSCRLREGSAPPAPPRKPTSSLLVHFCPAGRRAKVPLEDAVKLLRGRRRSAAVHRPNDGGGLRYVGTGGTSRGLPDLDRAAPHAPCPSASSIAPFDSSVTMRRGTGGGHRDIAGSVPYEQDRRRGWQGCRGTRCCVVPRRVSE